MSDAPRRRQAFRPRFERGDGPPAVCKRGGRAWLAPDEDWPACPGCGASFALLLQLDAAALPSAWPGGGLVQLFACLADDATCALGVNGPPELARLLRRPDDEAAPVVRMVRVPAAPPPRRIVGWEAVDDLPDEQEIGLDVAAEELADYRDRWPLTGEKLGGWPAWRQAVEYPACRTCGAPAAVLVYQLPVPRGLGYLFTCASHPHELTLVTQG